jgi:hypothetical protein
VPRLGFRIDRVTDEIAGKGPESTTLHLSLPGGGDDVTTAADGSFSYDASGIVDLIGSQWVAVSYDTASGDIVYRELQVPFVTVWRGRADIYMKGRPGSMVSVALGDGPTSHSRSRVECRVGPTGGCWLQFTDDDGHMVRARTNDHVESDVATDADFLIPAVSVKGVTSTDVISGTCLAGESSPFWFEAYRPAGKGYVSRGGMTTSAGTFSRDVTSKLDLRSGDKIYAECQLPAGDWVARFITVP